MKYLLLVVLILCLYAPAPNPKTMRLGKITVESITLRSKDGKHSIYLEARDESVGMWFSNEKGISGMVSTREGSPYVIFSEKEADTTVMFHNNLQIKIDAKYKMLELSKIK